MSRQCREEGQPFMCDGQLLVVSASGEFRNAKEIAKWHTDT